MTEFLLIRAPLSGGCHARVVPCKAMHWHEVIGMENEAVDLISACVKNPKECSVQAKVFQ